MKSYTGLITGNVCKADFLRDNLSVIEDLSWYCFELGNQFRKHRWWYNLLRLYAQARKMFPELNSKFVQNFLRFHFVTPKAKPKKPPKASIFVDYQNCKLQIDPSKKLTFFWLRFSRRNFPILGRHLIGRIIDPGKVKLAQIYERKGKLYCKLSYDNDVPPPKAEGEIVGLDMNTQRVALSSNRAMPLKRHHHRKIEFKKNRQAKRSLANYTKDTLHKLSRQIVDELSKEGTKVLVLEDLRNLRDSASNKKGTSKGKRMNHLVNSFPYAQFFSYLTYKCESVGIRVHVVDPAYTSKTCSGCGSRNTTRPSQPRFRCKDCGLRMDADLNASRNIRVRYTRPEWAPSESCP